MMLHPSLSRSGSRSKSRIGRVSGNYRVWTAVFFVTLLGASFHGRAAAPEPVDRDSLWSLKPIQSPPIPREASPSENPLDDFLAVGHRELGLKPVGLADKASWLRRVTMDLTGLAPTVAEQEAFLRDDSSGAYGVVVDRLMRSEQYGVRYGRHWLDVLRYTDMDEHMPAAPGIHLWRDWVVSAVNRDLPVDEFARAQILGNRARKRRIISAAGHLTPVEPRPEDLFALGFLARGAAVRDDKDQMLAFSAVETISTAFLGMTAGCAKCHDHFFDPIRQADYYSMKAVFDPLVLRPVELGTPEQVFQQGQKVEEYEARLGVLVDSMRRMIEPYHSRLYEERLSSFPPDVQAAIRKPEEQRSAAEQKTYDDYYPILRIDPPKIKAVMPSDVVKAYDQILKEIEAVKAPEPLPVFFTVEEDSKRLQEKSYLLTTGDPARPRKDREVQPGFLLGEKPPDFREGRRQAFVDWLTARDNPLFARVTVNRIWNWHFGSGLHASVSDFGALGGKPIHPRLLDWLSAEFMAHGYSQKWLHRLIVLSETYRRSSVASEMLEAENRRLDPENRHYWKFPLRRLEAEPLRDTLLQVAGMLDLSVGGKSYESVVPTNGMSRRTVYLRRGYRSFQDVMPDYLETFDAEDGRQVCTRRTQTVTAPQALWQMNNELGQMAAAAFGERLGRDSHGELGTAVALGFQAALGRYPSDGEKSHALALLNGDMKRLPSLAWVLFNLDEFLYVP